MMQTSQLSLLLLRPTSFLRKHASQNFLKLSQASFSRKTRPQGGGKKPNHIKDEAFTPPE